MDRLQQPWCSDMAERVTAREVRTWFHEHCRQRPDIGFWKASLDLILESKNPFDPEQRRQPKRGFLIGAGIVVVAVGWFAYFNFVH
jgi:hypothetical protein